MGPDEFAMWLDSLPDEKVQGDLTDLYFEYELGCGDGAGIMEFDEFVAAVETERQRREEIGGTE